MKDPQFKLKAVKIDPDGPAMLMTEEDASSYAALSAKYMADLQPRGEVESRLARSIIRTAFRLSKMENIRDSMDALQMESGPIAYASKEEARLTKMLLQLTKRLEQTQGSRRKKQIAEAMHQPPPTHSVH